MIHMRVNAIQKSVTLYEDLEINIQEYGIGTTMKVKPLKGYRLYKQTEVMIYLVTIGDVEGIEIGC